MDGLLERFLNKIGIVDKSSYQEASFVQLRNDKENNRIEATILFPTYVSVKTYQTLFDTINDFTTKGGFGIRLHFQYKEEKKGIRIFLDDFKEVFNCTMLDEAKYIDEEHKVIFYYKTAAGATEIDDETRKLKNFLDSISSSYRILTQEKVLISADDFLYENDEAIRSLIDSVPVNNPGCHELQGLLNMPFSESAVRKTAEESCIFKLNYRGEFQKETVHHEKTVYGWLAERTADK